MDSAMHCKSIYEFRNTSTLCLLFVTNIAIINWERIRITDSNDNSVIITIIIEIISVLWRTLTEVISLLNYCRDPETDVSRPGIEPGPPRGEASTLATSYGENLLIYKHHYYINDP